MIDETGLGNIDYKVDKQEGDFTGEFRLKGVIGVIGKGKYLSDINTLNFI